MRIVDISFMFISLNTWSLAAQTIWGRIRRRDLDGVAVTLCHWGEGL